MANGVLELQEIALYQILKVRLDFSGNVLVSDWICLNKTSLGIQNHGSFPPLCN